MISCPFGSGISTLRRKKKAIWYARLEKHGSCYGLSSIGLVSALDDTRLEHPIPDPLYGVEFNLSAQGILFTAIDPAANQAILSKNELYYIPLQTYAEDSAPRPQQISVPNYDGMNSSPIFSADGKSAAFLRNKAPSDDFDQPRIFFNRISTT